MYTGFYACTIVFDAQQGHKIACWAKISKPCTRLSLYFSLFLTEYHFYKLCNILYVGKTIDPLHERVNGHRSKFYYVVRHSGIVVEDCGDEQILGAHLVHAHNLKTKNDFNSSYRIFVLAHVNPTSLRKTEQSWIDKLRTRRPFGLNKNNSVG